MVVFIFICNLLSKTNSINSKFDELSKNWWFGFKISFNTDDKPLVSQSETLVLNVGNSKESKERKKKLASKSKRDAIENINSISNVNVNNELSINSKIYRSVVEYKIKSNENLSWFKKLGYLWCSSLRNEHIYLSLCCRDFGTNFTTTQRLCVLMIRLLITMSLSALYYGYNRTQSGTIVRSWTLIFWESLFGLYVKITYIYIYYI